MCSDEQQLDLHEPLLLLGNCNQWGHDLEHTKKHFSFTMVKGDSTQMENCLEVKLNSGKLSFQIVSAKSSWDWRLYPAGIGDTSRELCCDCMSRALLTINQEDKWAHGRNFLVHEAASKIITIRVLLSAVSGIYVGYRRGVAPLTVQGLATPGGPRAGLHHSPLLQPGSRPTLADVGQLRLVGAFCRWSPRAQGMLLLAEEPSAPPWGEPWVEKGSAGSLWQPHQICFRLHTQELEFQIISDKLGFDWRLFPRWKEKSGRVLPQGDCSDVTVTRGGKKDGHGKNFTVQEDALTIIKLTVWIEALSATGRRGPSCIQGELAAAQAGRICVTYTIQDAGVQVGIGSHEFFYPPYTLTSVEKQLQEVRKKPESIEACKTKTQYKRLAALQAFSVGTVRLCNGSMPLQQVRVAAMLMLLPSTLGEFPGVFRTYLQYHLLAPGGPRLAHIFIFLDQPPGSMEGVAGESHGTDTATHLRQWLSEAPEAKRLRPLVTLLEGSMSHGSPVRDRHMPEHREGLHSAAMRGELGAKQILNMERCLPIAEEWGIDWLICNLDADEALVCNGPAGQLFANAPLHISELQLLNHEAVPEAAEGVEDYFLHCTLFKRNPFVLDGTTSKARDCMKFWGRKVATAIGGLENETMKPLELYFTGYDHGKAAVRVRHCRSFGIRPNGAHRWDVPEGSARAVECTDASILHYNNCQGLAGIVRKYQARTGELWNPIRFHKACQELLGEAGNSGPRELVERGVALGEDEQGEVPRQLEAGVCARFYQVRQACREFAFLGSVAPEAGTKFSSPPLACVHGVYADPPLFWPASEERQ